MKLGIISDTHDNLPLIEKAVEIFNDANVDLVLHAGDYVSPFSIKPLLLLECDFLGVWGNNDGDKLALRNIAQGKIENSPLVDTYKGKKILIGHDLLLLESLISSQDFYLIVYGHTHLPEIKNVGNTLVVNPGECCGWVYGKATIAVADLDSHTAELISLT
ncbi:putative enzyme [uncultured Desulfobacterium sp.]|uniref:Phosphoesterase n=1 Tax=uncultured Desulfobacterium sp. TaxID=201089 RepID=A0A445N035_9BACT|nr:putative enzyme [uncultured Desulfobacterium sp.]